MTGKPFKNEIEVMLSDLTAGAKYRVYSENPQVCAPIIRFEAMLGGIRKDAEQVFSLAFDNGVEICTANGTDLKFFRKVW